MTAPMPVSARTPAPLLTLVTVPPVAAEPGQTRYADLPLSSVPRQRRRRGAAAVAPVPWTCENCDEHNAASRKRCLDCGTSRF